MEDQEMIRERSADVERVTVPMPVAPKQEVGPVSDLEALKDEVNQSFENLVDWINAKLKDKVIAVERSGRLKDEELKLIVEYMATDERIESIYTLMMQLHERIKKIDDRLTAYNGRYGRQPGDRI